MSPGSARTQQRIGAVADGRVGFDLALDPRMRSILSRLCTEGGDLRYRGA